jgi:fatty acid/phospholipid biosynthesis enzyme
MLLRPALRAVRDRTDPDTYGGAYLLGVRGLAVIAHGNAGANAIANAIRYAARGAAAQGSHLQPPSPINTVSGVASPENGDSPA